MPLDSHEIRALKSELQQLNRHLTRILNKIESDEKAPETSPEWWEQAETVAAWASDHLISSLGCRVFFADAWAACNGDLGTQYTKRRFGKLINRPRVRANGTYYFPDTKLI